MDLGLIVLGMVIGLVTVAPLGPVNIIIIRSALRRGLPAGLLAGTGSVVGDGIFASFAAYGVRWVETLVLQHALVLQVACGLVLAVMGVRTAFRSRVAAAKLVEPLGFRQATLAFLMTFVLTITNPATLFGFLGLFSSLGAYLDLGSRPYRPAVAVLGVMLGSFAWWFILSLLTARLKHRLTAALLERINRWAGIVIAGFGFVLLAHAAAR